MSDTCTNQKIIIDHLQLADRLARKFQGRGVEADDLSQVARVGLVKAAGRFDSRRGDFAPFATATIRGELKRHFRDNAWGVRPPRSVQDLQARIRSEHGSEVTSANAEDVATKLGTDVAEVLEAASARGCFAPDSLDAAREHGAEPSIVPDEFNRVDEWVSFCAVCSELQPDERQLLVWRFVEERTQQDIADRIGISQMQASRRIKQLMKRLQAMVAAPVPA